MKDVSDGFNRVQKKGWKAKSVKRKYALGEADVPKESSWLKVIYGFDGSYFSFAWTKISDLDIEPPLPDTVSSPNFSRIFGTNTNAFELLVKRKIMGPCWLQIKKPQTDNKGVRLFSSYLYLFI
jgi:DNA polymerase alpha subunit A